MSHAKALLVLMAISAAALTGCWRSEEANQPLAVSAQEVARGEVLFRENCQACHGDKGQGQDPSKPMGGQQAGGGYLGPALNGRGHMHHHKPDVLFGYLRNGSPAKDSPMRSFKDKLSEADMRAVLGYVYSLWPDDMKKAYGHSQH